MDLLEVTGLTKRYGGIVALSGAEFSARRGEVHALLGENGAGKSTLIQILAGAVRHDGGTIRVNGALYAPANPDAAHAAGISAVFQELSLIPDLTVEQNIWFRREALSRIGTVRRDAMRRRTLELFGKYDFPTLDPQREVRRLSLAERQIVEVAKGLASDPEILILDEATSTLPAREAEWLLALTRRLAAEGKLVIFISHRMAEVRNIADRLTIFRNGATVAVHEALAVSDDVIVAQMLGRKLDRLYPERIATATDKLALKVRDFSAGRRVRGASFDLREGEVLGVGGLQGHGQRELFQALFGATRSRGRVEVWGKPAAIGNPRQALIGRDGLALVPEDRRGQGILLTKSVRENLTISVIRRFSDFGLLSRPKEQALVKEMVDFLRIKTSTPEQPAGTLSGGNQQKVIFGKMLLTEARILLLYDPTRGVDVGTKGEIFQLMRDLAAKGYAILFYSSDLPELVHVADRVLVMRNGEIAATLAGEANSEEGILRAAVFEFQPPHDGPGPMTTIADQHAAPAPAAASGEGRWKSRLLDRAPFLVACLMLVLIVAIYGSLQRDVFTLDEINLDTTATLTLLLAATGQTIVLIRGGIDLSIGGMISFGTVLAATQFGSDPGSVLLWAAIILAIGFAVGALNGLLISVLRLQPFLITLATWSILSGAALIVLPTDGGQVPDFWSGFGSAQFLGLASPVWLLVLLLLFWFWFRSTRLGISIQATGSSEKSAFLSGVSLTRINVVTYGLSGLFAAGAALYLTTQTGAGSPTIGKDYILPSVAAAVIGGVSLFGGRGSLAGTVIGALILTIIGNLVFVLRISSYWQPVAQGVILLLAVLASSIAEKAARGDEQ